MTLALLAAVVVVTDKLLPNKAPLSFWEAKTAQWYLMNAVFIHFLMDGLSVFRGVPELHDLYYLLDARYRGDPTVDMLSLLELGLMAPMCIALYYAVHARAPWRHPLQLMTSAVQLFGTLMYVGTELHSFAGVHWLVDYALEFTFDHVVYFWFCIVFGMIVWIVVPLVLIAQSTRAVADAVVVAHRTSVIPAGAFRSLQAAAALGAAPQTAAAVKTTTARTSRTEDGVTTTVTTTTTSTATAKVPVAVADSDTEAGTESEDEAAASKKKKAAPRRRTARK